MLPEIFSDFLVPFLGSNFRFCGVFGLDFGLSLAFWHFWTGFRSVLLLSSIFRSDFGLSFTLPSGSCVFRLPPCGVFLVFGLKDSPFGDQRS